MLLVQHVGPAVAHRTEHADLLVGTVNGRAVGRRQAAVHTALEEDLGCSRPDCSPDRSRAVEEAHRSLDLVVGMGCDFAGRHIDPMHLVPGRIAVEADLDCSHLGYSLGLAAGRSNRCWPCCLEMWMKR